VRLVKGAYKEPKSVAFQVKSDVDRNYVRLMTLLLQRGSYPALATHDESEEDRRCAQIIYQQHASEVRRPSLALLRHEREGLWI